MRPWIIAALLTFHTTAFCAKDGASCIQRRDAQSETSFLQMESTMHIHRKTNSHAQASTQAAVRTNHHSTHEANDNNTHETQAGQDPFQAYRNAQRVFQDEVEKML